MKNSSNRRKIAIVGFTCILAATSFLFSCKKDNTDGMISKNKFDEVTKILDGIKLSGSITSSISENEAVLNYNNGSKYILIDEIPGSKININLSESSELITSKYGVIINDKSNGKILLLPNNDEESIQKFETVKLLLNNNYESSAIFGTVIINSEKS